MYKLERLPVWLTKALLIYMPLHVFLSTWLSTFTGHLEVWKAAKDLLVLGAAPLLIWIAHKQGLFNDKRFQVLIVLTLLYGAVHGVWVFNYSLDKPSLYQAFVYNNRLLWFCLIGFTAGVLRKKKTDNYLKIVLGISTLVATLGVIQYFLPADTLTHFGYSVARGVKPAFFIDDRPNLPRIMSTVRDPNSLGAYLILPTLLLMVMLVRKTTKRLLIVGLLLLHLLAIFLTFSRGAWIGLIIGTAMLGYFEYGKTAKQWARRHLALVVVVCVMFAVGFVLGRNSSVVQNYVLHRTTSTVQADPNQLRVQLQKQALAGIADKPFGHGPGTAGIVSIRNPKQSLLTENYYLQIAYEVGLLGLAVFIVTLVLIYVWLVKQTGNGYLQPVLLASFWSYATISLLIHLWSNEAVAAQWWLLSGLILELGIDARNIGRPTSKQ